VLFRIVNPFSNQLNQFMQLEQTGHVQDGRLLQHAGIRRRGSLIGPLSREGDRAGVFVEQGEDFAASHFAELEDQKRFSQQRMERVGYGRPSPMLIGAECSLLGLSRP